MILWHMDATIQCMLHSFILLKFCGERIYTDTLCHASAYIISVIILEHNYFTLRETIGFVCHPINNSSLIV